MLLAIIAVIGGIFLLGGACCLGSMIFSSSTETTSGALFDESQQIQYGYYLYYEIPAEAGETFDIDVTTDGSPVDVMIMTSDQFGEYEDAMNGLNNGNWYTLDTVTNVVSRTITYTADAYDTYYVVFDNTEDPVDGADAGKNLNTHVIIGLV